MAMMDLINQLKQQAIDKQKQLGVQSSNISPNQPIQNNQYLSSSPQPQSSIFSSPLFWIGLVAVIVIVVFLIRKFRK